MLSAIKIREIVIELFERREYEPCWFLPDGEGDCANWTTCDHGCPLVQLREAAGIRGTEDGSIPRD